jgi:hypothetical protein
MVRPEGHGLDLLAERLKMLFGDNASLRIDSGPDARASPWTRRNQPSPSPQSPSPSLTVRVYLIDDERLAWSG